MKEGRPNPTARPARGGVVDPRALEAFDDIVGRALRDVPLCRDTPPSRLRPSLLCIPTLLDQAHEVLEGNPLAARRFRQTLRAHGGQEVRTPIAMAVLARDPKAWSATPAREAPRRKRSAKTGWDRLVDPERIEPILAAAVAVSRDNGELAVMLGSVQLGLNGLDEMQALFDLALGGADPADLAGAFDTAVRVLLPGDGPFEPNAPGAPGFEPPGIGGGAGPGAGGPWFEWPPPGADPPRPEPVPVPVDPPRGPGVVDYFEECLLFEIIPELHRRGIGFIDLITGSSGHYVIDRVTPSDACPGDIITIAGSNFGGTTRVHFVDDAGHTVPVNPETVSETRVTVRLPAEARTGPVSLYIPIETTLCLVTHTMARPGHPGHIRVGRPSILRFEVLHGIRCLTVGDPATLVWSVLPLDAEVTITAEVDGTTSTLRTGAPAIGELAVSTTHPGPRTYTIEVHNPSGTCGDATASVTLDVRTVAPAGVEIMGVEVTQAIQVFSLADPPPVPNNSVGLIASMDTVFRVFVRTTYPATGPLARVTGVLRLDGVEYMPINAGGPFIPAQRAPNRARTDDSLNFLVPAGDASGTKSMEVEVFTTGACVDSFDSREATLTWVTRRALPVTIRRIADSGPAPNVISAEAAMAQILAAFRRIPSPRTEIRLHPGVHQLRRTTTEDNYCNDGGFYELALAIAYEHNDNEGYPPDSHESTWIGIFWSTGCTANGMMAWPSTSTCISQREPQTSAHEIMHTVGLGHTVTSRGERCEDIAQPVACHRLDGIVDGALNHVPFDIDANTTRFPARDLQAWPSGGLPRWLSVPLWIEGRRLIDTRY